MSGALSYLSRVESNYRSVNHAEGLAEILNDFIWGFSRGEFSVLLDQNHKRWKDLDRSQWQA